MKLNFLSKQKTSHLFAHLLVTSVLVLHNSHAQSADSVLTFSSTVTAATCVLSIVGNGSAAGGTAAATLNMPTIRTSITNAQAAAAQGAALATATPFTVGFVTAVGSTTACTYPGRLNVAFAVETGSSTVAMGTRTAVKTTADTTSNVGIEIASLASAGGAVTKAITDYATSPTYDASFKSSQHDLVSVLTGNLLNFQVTPVKTSATGSGAVAAGTLSIKVGLNVNYQ